MNIQPVAGWEDRYGVTKDGRVWAYPYTRECPPTKIRKACTKEYAGHWLVVNTNSNGYSNVGFYRDGKRRTYKVHRLVALAYLPLVEGKTIINHKNGIKTDNRVENLEWTTHKENTSHAFKLGLQTVVRGDAHWKSTMTEATISDMRRRYRRGETKASLARAFGVSSGHAGKICDGEVWQHIVI